MALHAGPGRLLAENRELRAEVERLKQVALWTEQTLKGLVRLVHRDGYIGESTKRELIYAADNEKEISNVPNEFWMGKTTGENDGKEA